MPRPKKPGAPEPKRRSRNGCWPCKNRKIKCGEERPSCVNCQRLGEACDYSIRLNWDGRRGKRPEQDVLDFTQGVPAPAVPAKGFRLVHQFPASNASTGRKFEPLVSTENTPQSLCTTAQPARPAEITYDGQHEPFQRPRKRPKSVSEATSVYAGERRVCSPPSSTVDSGTSSSRKPSSSITSATSPLTPATSSTYSDEESRQASRLDYSLAASPDTRRLSVHSLLSGPPGFRTSRDDDSNRHPNLSLDIDPQLSHFPERRYYGLDRGFPDLDLGKNDDDNAISTGTSPLLHRIQLDTPFGDFDSDLFSAEFAFGVETTDTTEETGGYYDRPVPMYIPHHLEPLPSKLLENQMNLLYFHHFINHTAKVLVPYDDPQANPFRTTLPKLAVKNENLLALVLAYSASHRARVLKQPEPKLRIATWVDDIFPTLRQALSDPQKNFSDANVATTIMLASLEIVSPKIFGYAIPWQKHLGLARELITARPGGLHYQTNFRQDNVCSFLWSWAAYLDIIGSLTGGPKDSSTAWMFDYEPEDMDDGYDEIDCIMGFTTRCVYLLAKIADLAKKCDAERNGDGGNSWQPNEETLEQAQRLEANLKDSMSQPFRPCKHIHTKGNLEKWDRVELTATNKAFHWAGLVHLYRRILGRPSDDDDVQTAVGNIVDCLKNLRPGSTTESCMLFPTFTAGCDARAKAQRDLILERLAAGEAHGMTQCHRARRLMQKVWETGQSWETLLSTEFIG